MSEYQYYEFRAIDRPLTERRMKELRVWLSRATITPTRFVNVYNRADLKSQVGFATRSGNTGEAQARLARIGEANAGKRSFVQRLHKAGLIGRAQ